MLIDDNDSEYLRHIDVSWIPAVLENVNRRNASAGIASTTSIHNTPVPLYRSAATFMQCGSNSTLIGGVLQVGNDDRPGVNTHCAVPAAYPAHKFDNAPVFAPNKIIDYGHMHENLEAFRVYRVVDYRHKATYRLRESLQDINVDKIIAKREKAAVRKKELWYLQHADKPEDTASNPGYPRYLATPESEKNRGWVSVSSPLHDENYRPTKRSKKSRRFLLNGEIRPSILRGVADWLKNNPERLKALDARLREKEGASKRLAEKHFNTGDNNLSDISQDESFSD